MRSIPRVKSVLLFLVFFAIMAVIPLAADAAFKVKSRTPEAEKTGTVSAPATTNATPPSGSAAKPTATGSSPSSSTPGTAATPPAATSGAAKPAPYVPPSSAAATKKSTAPTARTVSEQDSVGTVTHIEGSVDILQKGSSNVAELFEGDALVVGDIIRTKANSKAELTFSDGSIIRLAEKSRFQISAYQFNDKKREGSFNLSRGKIKAFVGKTSDAIRKAGFSGSPKFEVHTPTSVVGVKGTIFFVFYVNGVSGVYTEEGLVKSYSKAFPNKPVDVGAGKYVLIKGNNAPGNVEDYSTGAVNTLEDQTAPSEEGTEASGEDTLGSDDPLSDANSFSITGGTTDASTETLQASLSGAGTPGEESLIQQTPFMGWSGALLASFLDGGFGLLQSPIDPATNTITNTFTFIGMLGGSGTLDAEISGDYTGPGTYWQGTVTGTEYYGSAFTGYMSGSWLQATTSWEGSVASFINSPTDGPGVIVGYLGGTYDPSAAATFAGTGMLAGGFTGGTLLPCSGCDTLTALQGSIGTTPLPSINITNSINAMSGQLVYTSTGNKAYLLLDDGLGGSTPATWGITRNTFTGTYTTPGAGTYSTTLGGISASGYSLANATLTDDGTSGIRLNMVGTYIDPFTIETFSTNDLGAYIGSTLTGAGTGTYSATSLAFSSVYNGNYIYGSVTGVTPGSTTRSAIIGSAANPFQTLGTGVSAYMLGTAAPAAGEITWTSAVSGSNFVTLGNTFNGWMQGTTTGSGSASSLLKAIYVDTAGNAGIFNGSFSGSYYGIVGMTEQTGTLTAATPKITGYAGPATPVVSPSTGTAYGTFTGATGFITLSTSTQTASLTGQSWGIFTTAAGGAYSNPTSATGLTYSSGGSGWQGATGYWIANTTGTLSATSKTISGSLSGTYMTLTDMGTITGSMTGSYDTVNPGYMETSTLGEYASSSALTLSGAITTTGADFFGSTGATPWSGNMQGILGSTTSGGLFASPTFTILGTYTNPDAYSVYSSLISGSDVSTGSKFIGNNLGMVSGTSINGLVVGIYINPLTNATGIVKSTNVTGSLYPSFGMWEANGSFSTTLKGTTTVPVASLAWGNPAIVVASPSGTVTGDITGVISTQRTSLSDQNWGLSLSAISGVYGGATPGPLSAASGAIELDALSNPAGYTMSSITGSTDASGKVTGTLTGTTLTTTSLIQTNETVYGQVSAGDISAVGSGEFTSTPLTASGVIISDPMGDLLGTDGLHSGSIQGLFGSTTAGGLFASPSFTSMGVYTNPNNAPIYGSPIEGTDSVTGTKFVGGSIGTLFNDSINGGIRAIYVKPDGSAGIVSSNNVSGTLYPTYGMWAASGTLSTTSKTMTSGLLPADIFWGSPSVIDDWSQGSSSGDVSGYFSTDRVYLAGQNWGIASSEFSGTYSGLPSGAFTAKTGTVGLDMALNPIFYTISTILGSIDPTGTKASGTLTASTLTTNSLMTSTETIYGAVNGSSIAAFTLGEFTSTPLTVSGTVLPTTAIDPMGGDFFSSNSALGTWDGTMQGLLGSTTAGGLFASPSFVAMGTYSNLSGALVYGSPIQGNDTATGAAFIGGNWGTLFNDSINGVIAGIYVKPITGEAGIIKSTNVTGSFYPTLGMWNASGTITTTIKGTSAASPATLVWGDPSITTAFSTGTISSANLSGSIITNRHYLTDQPNWGISTTEIAGIYSGPSVGAFSASGGSAQYDVLLNPTDYSILAISGSVDAIGKISGTVTSNSITTTSLITTTETIYGALSASDMAIQSVGEFTSTPLTITGKVLPAITGGDMLQATGAHTGTIQGLLGSTTAGGLFAASPSFTTMGEYSGQNGAVAYATRIEGTDVTSGAAFVGGSIGSLVNDNINGGVAAIYVKNDGSAGIVRSTNVTGSLYPSIGMWQYGGTLTTTPRAAAGTTGLLPADASWNSINVIDDWSSGSASGDVTGYFSTDRVYLTGQNWGFATSTISGAYSGPAIGAFTSKAGTIGLDALSKPISYTVSNISGNVDALGTATGTVTGKTLTTTSLTTSTEDLYGGTSGGSLGADTIGEFTGASLTVSATIVSNYPVSWDFADIFGSYSGTLAGLIGSTTAGGLFASPSFVAMGSYSNPAFSPIYETPIQGTDLVSNAGFVGISAGTAINGSISGGMTAIYIKPVTGEAGIMKSTNVSGTLYPTIGMWEGSGTISTTVKNSSTIFSPIDALIGSPSILSSSSHANIGGDVSGSLTTERYYLTGETWGIATSELYGMYTGVAVGPFATNAGGEEFDLTATPIGYSMTNLSGSVDASGVASGTITRTIMTNTERITTNETFYGAISGSYIGLVGTGEFASSLPLGFSNGFTGGYYANWSGTSLITWSSTPDAILGSVSNPFATPGTPVTANMTGTAMPTYGEIMWWSLISGYNNVNGTDYVEGYAAGVTAYDGSASTSVKTIYIDAAGNAGILTGNLSGMFDSFISMTDQTGTLLAVQFATGYNSLSLPTINFYQDWGSGSGIFDNSGFDFISISGVDTYVTGIANEPWGVFEMDIYGAYDNPNAWPTYTMALTGTGIIDASGGYWYANATGNWNSNQTIDGTLSGKYITPYKVGTMTGDIFGSYDVAGAGIFESIALGEHTGTPFLFSKNINGDYYYICDGMCGPNFGDTVNAILGLTANPFTSPGTPVNAAMLGTSTPGNGQISWWGITGGYSMVNPGDYSEGWIGGVTAYDGTASTLIKNIYIDAAGNAGILSGSLSGTYDSLISMTDQTGTLSASIKGTGYNSAILPAMTYNTYSYWNNGTGVFDNSGLDYISITNSTLNTFNITGEPWGLFHLAMAGDYYNPNSSPTFGLGISGNNWSGSIGYWYGYASPRNWNLNQTLDGALYGKYITPYEFGTLTADMFGSYDTGWIGAVEAFAIGEYTGTLLAFSTDFTGTYYQNTDGVLPATYNTPSAIIGAATNPLSTPGTPVNGVHLLGTAKPTGNAVTWWCEPATGAYSGYNYINTTDYMDGFIGGVTAPDASAKTYYKSIYINAAGNAGVLTGNFAGMFDPYIGITDQTGSLGALQKTPNIYDPLMPSITTTGVSDLGSGRFSGVIPGDITVGSAYTTTKNITGEPWGVFHTKLDGWFNNPGASNAYSFAIGGANWAGTGGYWIANGSGNWNANTTIDGTLNGKYMTDFDLGTITGDIFGSYNTTGWPGYYEGAVIGEYSGVPLTFHANLYTQIKDSTESLMGNYTYSDGSYYDYTYKPGIGEAQINETFAASPGIVYVTIYYPDGTYVVETHDSGTYALLGWTWYTWDPSSTLPITTPPTHGAATITGQTASSSFYLYSTGTIAGGLGSTQTLWSGVNIPVTSIGAYMPGYIPASVWLQTNVSSYDSNTWTSTTYDGGAFYGIMGGSDNKNTLGTIDLNGSFVALYIDPATNAGFLSGKLSGNAYLDTEKYLMDGTVNRTQVAATTGILPTDIITSIGTNSMFFSSLDAVSPSSVLFLESAYGVGSGTTRWLEVPSINPSLPTRFGIFGTTLGGKIDTFASSWTAGIGGQGGFGPTTGYWLGFINDGATGANNELTGTITGGKYLTPTDMGTLSGDFYGTLNALNHPYFEGVAVGTWQDTPTPLSFYGKGNVNIYIGGSGVTGDYTYLTTNPGYYYYEYHNDGTTYNNIGTSEYFRDYGGGIKTHTYTVYYPDGTTRIYDFNTGFWTNGTWNTASALSTVVSTPPDMLYTSSTAPFSSPILGEPAGYSDFGLGGTQSLWSGGATPVTLMGSFNTGISGIEGPYVFGPGYPDEIIISSYNAIDPAKPNTTFDGGAFYGYTLGSMNKSYGLKALFYGLYIDPSGNVGILKSNNLTGTAYDGANILTMDGTIERAEMYAATIYLPENLVTTYVTKNSGTIDYTFNGNAGGAPINMTMMFDSIDQNMTYDFGVFKSGTMGTAAGAPTGPWNAGTIYNGIGTGNIELAGMEMTGANWSGGDISGNMLGYVVEANGPSPSTAILSGDVLGVYDPAATSTFDMVVAGAYMSVTKFLEMAGQIPGTPNTAALSTLNIPYAEVGRTNLIGNDGNVFVNMNNVIFFAYSNGAPAKIWATSDVVGSYGVDPAINTIISLNGSGLNAGFKIEHWDSTTNLNWLASVNGSGTYAGAGTMNGSTISFDGATDGTIDAGIKTFVGTGAGLVR